MISKCLLPILLYFIFVTGNVSIFTGVSIFSGVGARAPSARKYRSESSVSISYDEFGRIPELEDAQAALDNARSISVLRIQNKTLIAVVEDAPSTHVLSIPIGISSINIVSSGKPGIRLVITGLSADARYLYKVARKKAIEYAHLFDKSISIRLISQYLGRIIRENYMNNRRPLLTHMFLLGDSTIWEISCSGLVQEIVAGAAGLDRQKAIFLMERQYNNSMSRDEGHALLFSIYKQQINIPSESEIPPQVVRIFDVDD